MITKVCGERESYFTPKDVIFTGGLTLAAVLRGETAADCAAKQHIVRRVKGILSADWWNGSTTRQGSVMGYSARLGVQSLARPWEADLSFIWILINLAII